MGVVDNMQLLGQLTTPVYGENQANEPANGVFIERWVGIPSPWLVPQLLNLDPIVLYTPIPTYTCSGATFLRELPAKPETL